MCGLLGFIGQINKDNRTEVNELITAIFNETETRGKHASGYASLVNKDRNISYSKLPVKASLFTDHDIYYNKMWYRNPSMFIGHCRYATSGKPEINKNNHPFSADEGNLWMVHNGTCCGLKSEIPKHMVNSDCDSEYILRIVEKYGWNDGIQKVVNSTANFSLIFMDKKEKKIRFVRNKERPLYLIDATKKYGIWILCSTLEIFKSACEIAEVNHKDFKQWDTKVNCLYEISLETMSIKKKKFNKKSPALINTKYYNNYIADHATDDDDSSVENDDYWKNLRSKVFPKKKTRSAYLDSNGQVRYILN